MSGCGAGYPSVWLGRRVGTGPGEGGRTQTAAPFALAPAQDTAHAAPPRDLVTNTQASKGAHHHVISSLTRWPIIWRELVTNKHTGIKCKGKHLLTNGDSMQRQAAGYVGGIVLHRYHTLANLKSVTFRQIKV